MTVISGIHGTITLALLAPAVFALLLLPPASRRHAAAWSPVAALPALALGLMPETSAQAEGVLLGLALAVDAVNRPLLLLTGIAWSGAGWYAFAASSASSAPNASSAPRHSLDRSLGFQLFWLLALQGLMLVLLAADAAGFYLGYVVVTLSMYGLVIHERTEEALRAGRVYLVMALTGEAFILTGLLILGAQFDNVTLAELGMLQTEQGGDLRAAVLCLLVGFAVKMGTVPLHVWLPLAHPVAPVPASAVLSGVLVKAGLIGWLRFAPPEVWPEGWALGGLVVLGLISAFYGVAAGLGQARLKTVLAYSTVSQMGLLLAAFGLSLAGGEERAAMLPVIGLMVLHHGLNKAALFLAAGSRPGASRLRLVLLALPALSLAGAPLTSGSLAKSALGTGFAAGGLGGLGWLLALSSLATALLMLRVFHLARRDDAPDRPLRPAWFALTAAGVVVPWAWAGAHGLAYLPGTAAFWDGTWPILVAVGIAVAWVRLRAPALRMPEGDILALVGRLAPLGAGWRLAPLAWLKPREGTLHVLLTLALASSERWLRTFPAAGLLLLLIATALLQLLR